MTSNIKKDFIERVLSSPGRYRVLKYLLINGGGNINKISRELDLSYSLVKKYLEEMISVGIVEEIRLGRTRYFTPVWTDPRLRILKELVDSEREE
jgi:predicted transcriptional regulator